MGKVVGMIVRSQFSIAIVGVAVLGLFVASESRAGLFDDFANKAREAVEQTANDLINNAGADKPDQERAANDSPAQESNTAGGAQRTSTNVKRPAYEYGLVKSVQRKLNELGYQAGTPDGAYGPATRRAIERFQSDHGVPVNGIPSPQLEASLDSALQQQGQPAAGDSTAGSSASPSRASGSSGNAAASPIGGDILRPLNLQRVNGKPAFYPLLSPTQDSNIAFRRFIELLIISDRPRLIEMPADKERQRTWCYEIHDFAKRHLTERAWERYFDPANRRGALRSVCGGYWAGASEFEQRRTLQRFVEEVIPSIQAEAARLALPHTVAIVKPGSLPPYDFSRKSFRVNLGELDRNFVTGTHPLGLDNFVVPGYRPTFDLSMPANAAEKLRSRLQQETRRAYDRRHKVARLRWVAEVSLQGLREIVINPGTRHERVQQRMLGRVQAVRLYSDADESFTSPLYTVDQDAFFDEQAYSRVAASGEQKRRQQAHLASLERIDVADFRYMAGAYARAAGGGQSAIDQILDKAHFSNNAFENQKRKDAERPGLLAAYQRVAQDDKGWFIGKLEVGPYDLKRGMFPVRDIDVQDYSTTSSHPIKSALGVRVQLKNFELAELPLPTSIAEQIEKQRGNRAYTDLAFRALLSPVEVDPDDLRRDKRSKRFYFKVHRLEVVYGKNADPRIVDPETVIWTGRGVGQEELAARAAAERAEKAAAHAQQLEQFRARLAECKRQPLDGSRSQCVRRVCVITGDGGLNSQVRGQMVSECDKARDAASQALAAQREAAQARKQAAYEAEQASRKGRRNCERHYQEEGLVQGTTEFRSAVETCMNAPVREPYGPSILGVRLGMSAYDVNRVAKRAMGGSGSKRLSTRESQPFKVGLLFHTRDASHGIAVFLAKSGASSGFNVAGIGRRQYFSDPAPSMDDAIDAMRRTYGKEAWQEGNVLLWSESPDAERCAGVRKFITERGGWSRGWVPPGAGHNDQPRQPLLISADGSPEAYAAYSDCGPLLFAYVNPDADGKLADLALVLFDPQWLAELPRYRFNRGNEDGQLKF